MTVMISCNTNKKAILTVSAASSLTDAMKEINSLYLKDKQNTVILMNFNGSGSLERQIENGAPTDIFISASINQMDNLQEKHLIINDTRKNLLSNKIVMIVPDTSTLGLTGFMDLAKDNIQKIAIGDPESVPAGMYAEQVFDKFAITGKVLPKLIICSNVRQVLTYVESKNVDAGIVFFSDTKNNRNADKIKIAATGPDSVNTKIVYPVAIIKSTSIFEAAKDYENFLFGNDAKMIFKKYGFIVISN